MKFKGMVDFRTQVNTIAEHRRGNNLERASAEEVAEDLDAYTCQRLGNDSRYCKNGVKKNYSSPSSPSLADRILDLAGHAARAVSNLSTGARILLDWLGSGSKPVSFEHAQARADVCTGRLSGEPCPQNQDSSAFVGFITADVARRIQEQVGTKNAMALKVEGEDRLHTCAVCWCHLPLKVHVPTAVLLDRTPKPMLKKFPGHCWLVKESQTPNPITS